MNCLALLTVLLPAYANAVRLGKQQPPPRPGASSSGAGGEGDGGGFARFSLTDDPSARCLDGSPGGGYERIVPGSSTVVLQLEGGGFCDSFESCSARVADAEGGLGGSAAWGASCGDRTCAGVVSSDCRENPDFCGASLVLVRFCSGDHWRGTRTEPTRLCGDQEGGRGCGDFRFGGERILDAALQRLLDTGALRSGSRLILSGRSSGGVGVLNGIDRVAERLAARSVDVRGLLLWSMDVDYPTLPGYNVPWYQSGQARDQQDTQRKHQLYGARAPKACEESGASRSGSPWLCKPHEVVARLKTPVFVATNHWSSLALGDFRLNATTCAYARRYGGAVRTALEGVAEARTDHGIFAASCFAHTVPWTTTVPSPACSGAGCVLREVFASWYFGDGRRPRLVVEDDCPRIPCNSLCESQRPQSVPERCLDHGAQKRKALTREDLEPSRSTQTVVPRPGPRAFPTPAELVGGDAGDVSCKKLAADMERDGFAVLRRALPQGVIQGALTGMSRILDLYAGILKNRSMIESGFEELPLDKRALALFEDRPEVLPRFFRSELHASPEFYDVMAHLAVRRAASCLLKTRTLVVYPVYMARMNLPNIKQQKNGFHQDSLYTYEYFNANASEESMEKFMSSKVNFWAPLKDVDVRTGTLMVRRGFGNRMSRYNEWTGTLYGSNFSELVTDASEVPPEEAVLLDDLKAGDLVVMAHYTPHRGTPNSAQGRVRWSMDWRLQNGQFSTMRDESGYLVQSDAPDDGSLVTRERWGHVTPSPRYTERSVKKTQISARAQRAAEEVQHMELGGSRTALAPGACVKSGPSSAAEDSLSISQCHRLADHP